MSEAVAELSRRLDGLPLAMELAAARTRLLEPAALLARVEHGLALLRWDTADLPPRHRTLRATLDWSYALLSPEEQAVFRRLGVFAGGFTLEAVGAVAATDELGVEPLDVVQGLVDKHLVRVLERAAGEEPRFGLLATVREYALRAAGGERRSGGDARSPPGLLPGAGRAGGARHARSGRGTLAEPAGPRGGQPAPGARVGDRPGRCGSRVALRGGAGALLGVARLSAGRGRSGSKRRCRASYEADPALRARFLEGAGTARPLVR